MPPVPEKDPIVTKSYAAYYVIAMMILMVTLFWALWDESFGQRPWKAFQHEWKDRYSAFLNTARSKSSQSEKGVEQDSQYQQLEKAYKDAYETAKPRRDELQKQISDLSAKILAVQNVFTDRRAYVNALTYELETETSASGKKSKQEDIDDYKKRKATVEFPDGHRQQYNFQELEETYNSLKAERTKVSAELGEVLKPVTEASNQTSAYISDHMVDLTPTQIDGLKKKAADWDAQIVQINVPEANIVDRCESCHMNAREPIRVTSAVMMLKGEKRPDEYAQRLHQPSRTGIAEDARSRQVRLLALPSGQRPGDHQRRKSPWQLRALVVAAVSQTECRSRLPDLPRRRYAPGRGRCRRAHLQWQIPFPAARLHGLPSLRRLRQGTGRPDLDRAADEAVRPAEDRQFKDRGGPDEAGRRRREQ